MADNCKFQKKQYQVSYDSGTTWENVVPSQIAKGELIEYDSPDCTNIDTSYRWRVLDGQYLCNGNNKYKKEIQEESYNNGITWYATYPTVYRQGQFVGVDAEFCCDKFVGHYYYIPSSSGGGGGGGGGHNCGRGHWNGYRCDYSRDYDPLKVVKCDGTDTLTSDDVKYYNSDYYIYNAEIGDSVRNIDYYAFYSATSLTSVDIPNSVIYIADNAFARCSGLTSITIPYSVISIQASAFKDCTSLTSITVEATTPPRLGNQAFDNTNNCHIYVPSGSVDAYKTASGWSTYASRIQAIP